MSDEDRNIVAGQEKMFPLADGWEMGPNCARFCGFRIVIAMNEQEWANREERLEILNSRFDIMRETLEKLIEKLRSQAAE